MIAGGRTCERRHPSAAQNVLLPMGGAVSGAMDWGCGDGHAYTTWECHPVINLLFCRAIGGRPLAYIGISACKIDIGRLLARRFRTYFVFANVLVWLLMLVSVALSFICGVFLPAALPVGVSVAPMLVVVGVGGLARLRGVRGHTHFRGVPPQFLGSVVCPRGPPSLARCVDIYITIVEPYTLYPSADPPLRFRYQAL